MGGGAGEFEAAGAPDEASRFLRDESALWVRSNQLPIPIVVTVGEAAVHRTKQVKCTRTGKYADRKGDRTSPSRNPAPTQDLREGKCQTRTAMVSTGQKPTHNRRSSGSGVYGGPHSGENALTSRSLAAVLVIV